MNPKGFQKSNKNHTKITKRLSKIGQKSIKNRPRADIGKNPPKSDPEDPLEKIKNSFFFDPGRANIRF